MSAISTKTFSYNAPTAAELAQAEDWVARFAARWASPNPENLRDLMHPDTQNLIPPMTEPGNADEVIAHFKRMLGMVPDFRLEVVRWAPVGDTVILEWEAHTNVAGKPLSWRGIDSISLRDGKTYKGQVFWDTRGVAEMLVTAVAEAKAKSSSAATA